MQSAYGLYKVNRDKDALFVSTEESPNKVLEIRDSGVWYLARTVKTDIGLEWSWNILEEFMIKEFKPFFKLKQAPLPSLRYDIMSYFK
jgi:hypothetical protein